MVDCIVFCCYLFLQVRLYWKCIWTDFSWFMVLFMHTPLKYASSCAHNSGQRREKTHETKSMRLIGWVVAGGPDEPLGRGDTNKTVSHRLVWWCASLLSWSLVFWHLTSPVFFYSCSVSPAAAREADEVSPRTGIHFQAAAASSLHRYSNSRSTCSFTLSRLNSFFTSQLSRLFLMRAICVCLLGLVIQTQVEDCKLSGLSR